MIEIRPVKSNLFHSVKTLIDIKTLLWCVLLMTFMLACSKEKPDKISAIKNRAAIPKLHATDITTVISDSGVTRYRISTPRWDVYDKAAQPYQEFPKGIYFEKFDENLKVDANIQSQYARFNENEKLWILRGKVRAMNLQGELFETSVLYWNQQQEKFYTDSAIKITQTTRIIKGIGFESNQSMTKYMIKKPQGIFPVSDKATEATPAPTMTTVTPQSQPVLPAAVNHKAK